MYTDFPAWVQEQLDERDWTQADLIESARVRGYRIDPAQISRMLSREQEAGVYTVIAIAHGFELPREVVFKQRGWLLPNAEEAIAEIVQGINEADLDPRLVRFVEEIMSLSPSARNPVLTAATAILDAIKVVVEENSTDSGSGQWVTVEEAAERSGYAVRTIQRLAQEGRIEAWKPGHELFTTVESVLAYKARVQMGRPKMDANEP